MFSHLNNIYLTKLAKWNIVRETNDKREKFYQDLFCDDQVQQTESKKKLFI